MINQWQGLNIDRVWPLFFIFLHCFLSSLGGVSTEFLLKKDPEMSIHAQNLYLYLLSLACNTVATVLSGSNPLNTTQFFEFVSFLLFVHHFSGYNAFAFVVVALYALAGLSTSFLLKNLDAIMKEYASAFVMVVWQVQTQTSKNC
jgi:hypothetical protein